MTDEEYRQIPVVFEYKGPAYNRPCNRGICISEALEDLCDKIPEGYFHIEIVVRKQHPILDVKCACGMPWEEDMDKFGCWSCGALTPNTELRREL